MTVLEATLDVLHVLPALVDQGALTEAVATEAAVMSNVLHAINLSAVSTEIAKLIVQTLR